MANVLSFPKDLPGRFRLVIDDMSGGLNSDANPAFLNANEFPVLSNLLVDQRPPLRKRGSVARASTDTYTGGVLGYFTGTLRTTTARPYYVAGSKHYAQAPGVLSGGATWDSSLWDSGAVYDGVPSASGASVQVSAGTGFSLGGGSYYTPPAQVGDTLVFANKDAVLQCAGTAHLPVTGSGATFATSSTDVTGLAGMNSTHVGSFITNTGDSVATLFAYRIAVVVSDTEVTLDQAYAGSNSGSSKAWRVSSAEDFVPGGTDFSLGTSSRLVKARCVASMWRRLVVANTTEGGVNYPFRIRWSGIYGSTEGTAPFTGIAAFSGTGFVDCNAGLGEIVGMVPFADTLVVFQREGITIVHGVPVYADIGSLDVSVKFPGFRLSTKTTTTYSYGPYCSGSEGVFYYDRARGPMLWTGVGAPKSISQDRVSVALRATDPDTAGYHRGYCFFTHSVSNRTAYAYYAPHNAWTSYVSPSATGGVWDTAVWGTDVWATATSPVVGCLMGGRPEAGFEHYLVGLAASGTVLVNFSNTVDYPGGVATDWTGDEIVAAFLSAAFGDPTMWVQPDTLRVTYKSVGDEVYATVYTGLPGGTHSYQTGAGQLPANTSAKTVTVQHRVGVTVDEMVQVALTHVANVSTFEVYRVVVEGSIDAPRDSP